MASTYTVNTGIELIANGEQSGTWGDTTTNVNLEIIDRLTNGVGAITLSGTTHTLTTTDGTLVGWAVQGSGVWWFAERHQHGDDLAQRSGQAVLHP
jgi:hypothetical protein